MKNKMQKEKISRYKASRGVERQNALERGNVWIRPTICMEMKTTYSRNRQKKETRSIVQEYSNH